MEKINSKDKPLTKDPKVLSRIQEMESNYERCVMNFLEKSFWHRWSHKKEFDLETENILFKFKIWYQEYQEKKESKRIKNLIQDFREANELMNEINEKRRIVV